MIKTSTLNSLTNALASNHGASLKGDDREFTSVCIDSRAVQAGSLFVAIVGPNFDGHDFVETAIKAGAVGVVVSHDVDTDVAQIKVADTRLALAAIGAWNRQRFSGPVLSITGSSGKTSVKELSASILRQSGEVLATLGNLNNDFGVPLTLARISDEHNFAVIEMGASARGEIAYSSALAQADCCILNNVAAAHIEGFGSLQGVAEAKAEIIQGLSDSGHAVLNFDDEFFPLWCGYVQGRPLSTFSLHNTEADFYASGISQQAQSMRFTLHSPQGVSAIELGMLGEHNVSNALAATAACMALGSTLEQVQAGLAKVQSVAGRSQCLAGVNDSVLINDTYNANPASFVALIDMLKGFTGDRILVVGDMAELGADGLEAHAEVGRYARGQGIEHLYAVGAMSSAAVEAFGAAGGHHFANKEQLQQALIKVLAEELAEGVTVAVKGSRSSHMEDVINALKAPSAEGNS